MHVVVLGIDGGGTRTRASIVEGDRVLAYAENGSIKRLRVGAEAAEKNLRALLRDVFTGAEVTGVRYHVAHISSHIAVEMVAFAKARGLNVTAEATPHHFVLADSDMLPYDSNYKMKPPLREQPDVAAVTQGLISGVIDAIILFMLADAPRPTCPPVLIEACT